MIFMMLFSLLIAFHDLELSYGPTHRETITRTLKFSNPGADNQLLLKNVVGNVKVVGYEGDEVKITVVKTIEANNQSDLQRGIEEIQLASRVEGNTMLVYMDATFADFQWRDNDVSYQVNRQDDDYSYRLDFSLQVPRNLNLNVSTVNGGVVELEKVSSRYMEARNVNGSIRCTDISGQTTAITVNGDVDIQYARAPLEESQFKTINGNITLQAPQNLSVNVSFKSMNGDFYTNFDELAYLPAEVKANESSSGKRTTYRIGKTTRLRVGKGGPLLKFETLNGEVYLKHN